MSNVAISYRNWAFEIPDAVVNALTGTFEANAPLSNLLTPRLGQLAIATSIGNRAFEVEWGQGSPTFGARVDIIALLNHNIIHFASGFTLDVYDADGGSYVPAGFPQELISVSSDGTFQSHLIWVMGDTPGLNRDRVNRFVLGLGSGTLCGTRNEYTGVITQAPFQAGAVWAGPKLSPTNGISLEGFAQSIVDNSRVVRSIGGQVWTTPEIRQRMCAVEFPGLTEDEVYALAPSQSLQQLAAFCGISRPLIIVPVAGNSDLTYLSGFFGYLMSPPKWNSFEKTGSGGVQTRLYTGSMEVLEAR